MVSTLGSRLDLEALINASVRLGGRVGGALPGRKVLTLVHAIVAGASHIDHADVLRAGGTQAVLAHRVMLDVGHVPSCVHLRPCPPARSCRRCSPGPLLDDDLDTDAVHATMVSLAWGYVLYLEAFAREFGISAKRLDKGAGEVFDRMLTGLEPKDAQDADR